MVDDYEIVYIHGDSPRNGMPGFGWFRQFYQMIDRRLRKNLKHLYIVRPSFWIKAMLKLARPFIRLDTTTRNRFEGCHATSLVHANADDPIVLIAVC